MAKHKKSDKVNPRRRPATEADMMRAVKIGTDEAVSLTRAIFLTVLRDKEGYDNDRLLKFWEEVESLSDEIVEGRVSLSDLKWVLREEAGIFL